VLPNPASLAGQSQSHAHLDEHEQDAIVRQMTDLQIAQSKTLINWHVHAIIWQ
jgi:hypothetical protein